VNYNFGDIVVDGKVIPFMKEAVHFVLDFPFGDSPFLANYTTGSHVYYQDLRRKVFLQSLSFLMLLFLRNKCPMMICLFASL
jgi:hypothetical protein